jgi:hypothetical protein
LTKQTNGSKKNNNIAKSVSANQDNEVWMDIHSCRDHKHANEVQAMIENDEIMKPIL